MSVSCARERAHASTKFKQMSPNERETEGERVVLKPIFIAMITSVAMVVAVLARLFRHFPIWIFAHIHRTRAHKIDMLGQIFTPNAFSMRYNLYIASKPFYNDLEIATNEMRKMARKLSVEILNQLVCHLPTTMKQTWWSGQNEWQWEKNNTLEISKCNETEWNAIKRFTILH